ncbi:MAG: 50S ribosomal protein L11 methyltransferase [Bdellovibrio sp.]
MNKFYNVKIAITKNNKDIIEELCVTAISDHGAIGCSMYDLSEGFLDEEFGDETLCGGNPDEHFIEKIENLTSSINESIEVSFDNAEKYNSFCELLKVNDIEFETNIHENQDWNEEWRKSFKKIEVEEYQILPSWDEFTDEKVQLKIYPGMGFGTGSHETTFLCLKQFLNTNLTKEKASVLDFGAGSGILGLFAKKFFSCEVDFVDIDEDARTNALQNFELNFENGKINYFIRNEFRPTKKYQFVFANILLEILKLEKETIVNSLSPEGYLILSGILNNQMEELVQFYGLKVVGQESKNDWCCVVLKK